MEQRKMKGTEEMVSLLGLGCMRFPHETPGSDDIDVEKAEKMIDYAIKHGVKLLLIPPILITGISLSLFWARQ